MLSLSVLTFVLITRRNATADQEKVDIRLHRVIYNVIEEIEQAMKGMLDPIFKEVVIGHAEVRNVSSKSVKWVQLLVVWLLQVKLRVLRKLA